MARSSFLCYTIPTNSSPGGIAMLYNCLAVGAGGALGAVARYLVGLIPLLHRGPFPCPPCSLTS